jgi:preprotein translocase subunit YajC
MRHSAVVAQKGEHCSCALPKKMQVVPVGHSRVDPSSVQPRVQKPPGAVSTQSWPPRHCSRDSHEVPTVTIGPHDHADEITTASSDNAKGFMGARVYHTCALAAYPRDGYMREPLNPMSLNALPALDVPVLLGHPLVLAQALGGGLAGNLIFIGLIFGIMYFVLIRPQQKQAKETASMLASLKKGDEVITSGGLVGRIFSVDEKFVVLEIATNVKVRVLKSSIQAKVTVEPPKSTEASDAKKEEK